VVLLAILKKYGLLPKWQQFQDKYLKGTL
jgi:hypothetical protein